jgi:hypothetical protein
MGPHVIELFQPQLDPTDHHPAKPEMLRRPSLRSQLNQIRLWVRQGRTDAWIAHKLDISVDQLAQFKREQKLTGEPAPPPPPLEEDEILTEPAPERPTFDDAPELADEEEDEPEREADRSESGEGAEIRRRRRRGRRGGRRRSGRRQEAFEATFEHGEEGYGLWLDPAVANSEVYSDHWAGHRAVVVTLEADAITIKRAEAGGAAEETDEEDL